MLRKLVLFVVCAVVILGVSTYAAFQLSPWPSVLLIRHSFDKGGAEAAASISHLVPKDVSVQRGQSYAPGDPDAMFDVFAPAHMEGPLPAVVWVHGGGFVAGTRSDLSGYLQILAARGFVTVGIDYSLAPSARFPTPMRQTNAALAHVIANAKRFNIDPERIFLAGDSAGAQIAAQAALIVSDANYARRMGMEAIRDLARSGLSQSSLEVANDRDCVATLSYVYDHGARELPKRLTQDFHAQHGLAQATLHVHLDHDSCLEVRCSRARATT